jgi:3-oxoacyl-[acyl-carrier protein] reductase
MDLQLRGKRALVAAASRGLGFATARGLALEGCRVAINSRSHDKLANAAMKISEETGVDVFPLAGDVSDPETPARLVAQAVEAMGGLDLLVTNSGGPPPGKFEALSEVDWAKAVNLTLMSHMRFIRAALPYLKQSPAASVLAITSYSVKQPIPNLILSNSVRLATVGMIKSLALELGGEGIRFNSILPAWTETERLYELLNNRAHANGTTVEEEIARQAKDSPLGRMGTLEEFANPAVFLLSPAASYLTGVMLTVDGGLYKGLF